MWFLVPEVRCGFDASIASISMKRCKDEQDATKIEKDIVTECVIDRFYWNDYHQPPRKKNGIFTEY
jgi:hypothetical protein